MGLVEDRLRTGDSRRGELGSTCPALGIRDSAGCHWHGTGSLSVVHQFGDRPRDCRSGIACDAGSNADQFVESRSDDLSEHC
jgi:hypothetical protein